MAYTIPQFNLTCNIYTLTNPSTKTLRVTTVCNLAMGHRQAWPWSGGNTPGEFGGFTAALLLPALTDVRDQFCNPGINGDAVEVPAGSGRWYFVVGVDDIGKGFANEHRFATLQKIGGYNPWAVFGIPWWPAPIP